MFKNKLIKKYARLFKKVYEKGGGFGFRYYHGLRVMKYCENFLAFEYFKNKSIDRDALLIAALFHDIGKIKAVSKSGEIKYNSQANLNHDKIGAKIVSNYIGKFLDDDKLLEKVKELIGQQHNQQTSIEAKMIKDADRLDNYGCLQIWRHMTNAHQAKRNLDQVFEYWFEQNGGRSAKEYLKKFNFTAIRKIAIRRLKKLNSLILDLKNEFDGVDFK